jgi:RNAse (barnase) inhibitor barstar
MGIYTYITKLFIIVIIFSQNSFSQNIDKIKKSDTIYIYFKKNVNFQEYYIRNIKNEKANYDDYFFLFKSWYPINLEFHHFYTQEERKVKKSFLRKNKDLILTYNFLTKFSLGEVTELIGHKKKVYIIDSDEIGLFTIKLKEVNVIGLYWPGIE